MAPLSSSPNSQRARRPSLTLRTPSVVQEKALSQARFHFHSLLPHQCVTFLFLNSYLSIIFPAWRIVTGGTPVRPNKKWARVPRFTAPSRLEQRYKLKFPSPLVSSMPPSTNKKLVAAAQFESGVWMLSEWILCIIVLYLLPTEQQLCLLEIAHPLATRCQKDSLLLQFTFDNFDWGLINCPDLIVLPNNKNLSPCIIK